MLVTLKARFSLQVPEFHNLDSFSAEDPSLQAIDKSAITMKDTTATALVDSFAYEYWQEKCLLRLNNHRLLQPAGVSDPDISMPSVDRDGNTSKMSRNDGEVPPSTSSPHTEPFFIENTPNKLVLVTPVNVKEEQEINMFVYHSEAGYFIKRALFEKMRTYWKELGGLNLSTVLGYVH